MLRAAVAVTYVALVALFFVGYYTAVRSAPPDTIVDYTPVVVWLGFISFVPGLLIGRWWSALLPLMAVPFAAVMLVVCEVDESYSSVASDRGGEVGTGWFGVAFLLCTFALPSALIGAGLGRLARRR